MSRFWELTSPLSVPRPQLFTVARSGHQERIAAVGLLALAVPWLAYTRFYFWLQPRQLTFDGPFMYLTGKPDPGCGLTRTFAWMWHGDLAHAVMVYPLGPVIFFATFALVAYALSIIVFGHSLRLPLSPVIQRNILIVTIVGFGLNWASKLLWLGM